MHALQGRGLNRPQALSEHGAQGDLAFLSIENPQAIEESANRRGKTAPARGLRSRWATCPGGKLSSNDIRRMRSLLAIHPGAD